MCLPYCAGKPYLPGLSPIATCTYRLIVSYMPMCPVPTLPPVTIPCTLSPFNMACKIHCKNVKHSSCCLKIIWLVEY